MHTSCSATTGGEPSQTLSPGNTIPPPPRPPPTPTTSSTGVTSRITAAGFRVHVRLGRERDDEHCRPHRDAHVMTPTSAGWPWSSRGTRGSCNARTRTQCDLQDLARRHHHHLDRGLDNRLNLDRPRAGRPEERGRRRRSCYAPTDPLVQTTVPDRQPPRDRPGVRPEPADCPIWTVTATPASWPGTRPPGTPSGTRPASPPPAARPASTSPTPTTCSTGSPRPASGRNALHTDREIAYAYDATGEPVVADSSGKLGQHDHHVPVATLLTSSTTGRRPDRPAPPRRHTRTTRPAT